MDDNIVITDDGEAKAAEVKKKTTRTKKLILKGIAFFVVFVILGSVITGLSAILPKLPYTFTEPEQLKTIGYGFPINFVWQTRDDEQYAELAAEDFNKEFILPRYDKYATEYNIWLILADIGINTAIIGFVFLCFGIFKKLSAKCVKFLLMGFLICIIAGLLPAFPGTFTVDTLEPMHFGFPLKYVEQTPDVNSIKTNENLETILEQSFISPKFIGGNLSGYKTHIVAWKLILSAVLNAILLAAAVNIIIIIRILTHDGSIHDVYDRYFKRWKALVLMPMDKKKILPEHISREITENSSDTLSLGEEKQ